MNAVLNHLWQSTVIAACASLLGLALGRYRPAVRFRVWLVASLQFLFPLSLLVSLGGLLHRSYPAAAAASLPTMQIGAPSLPAIQIGAALVVPASSAAISVPSASGAAIWPALLLGVWACGAVVVFVVWLREWLRIRALVRRAAPLDLGLPVRTVSGPARIELGVFGVLRPVLFVPEGLPESLSPGQLRAVLAHELCHVRRRDNLWAALHALVQAAFWFHPLVWWLGGRMTRDRELACDEGAVRLGASADEYAHGLLKICAAYTTAPAACMSGVSGADLKQRVLWIANGTLAPALGKRMRWMLALCAALAVAAPLAAGVLLGPAQAPAPKSAVIPTAPLRFDAATVAVSPPGALQGGGYLDDGEAVFDNRSMLILIARAYGLPTERVLDGPSWLTTNHYEIRAKTSATATPEQMQRMLQALLADRFGLVAHIEQRPMPAYALTLAGTSQLKPAADSDEQDNCQRSAAPAPRRPIQLNCTGMTMQELAGLLPQIGAVDIGVKPVVDRTGLTGKYDFTLRWMGAPQLRAPSAPDYDPNVDISLFSALAKLGLKLTTTTAPLPVVVVDSVSPTLRPAHYPLPPMPSMPTSFEVAAIKPQGNGTQKSIYDIAPGGEIDICCFPLSYYIWQSFDINLNTIVNPPKWFLSTSPDDRWEVLAKTVPGVNYDDIQPMLQNLLKTRFGFVYHEATLQTPVLALRAGDHPQLKPNTDGGNSNCTGLVNAKGNAVITCNNVTMAQFAAYLQLNHGREINKPVVDETGLKGTFDFTLTRAWIIPNANGGAGAQGGAAPATAVASTPTGAPSVFEALNKQLGLKLVSDKQPAKVIVIDHLNRTPTPN